MDKETYGTRLYGYSEKNGKNLYMYSRDLNGRESECKLGIIKSSYQVTHGPITIQVWELENGAKYHHY